MLWLILMAVSALLIVKGVHLHFFWITDIVAPLCIVALYWLIKRSNVKGKLNVFIDNIGTHSLEIYVANLTTLRLVEAMKSTVIVETVFYVAGTALLSVLCIGINTKIQSVIHVFEKQ